MVRLANTSSDLTCWRRPGATHLRRNTADGYVPDAAGVAVSLARYVTSRNSDIPGRPDFNFLVSVKSQNTPGSAKQKLGTEIEDLAGVCDTTGLVAAVILQGSHFDRGAIAAAKRKGALHMVAVLTEAEVDSELLPSMVKVARQRQAFRRKLGPRGGLAVDKRFGPRDFAYVHRSDMRRDARLALRVI